MARVMASELGNLQAQREELAIKHRFLTDLTRIRREKWQDAKHDLRRTQIRLRRLKAKISSISDNDPFYRRLPPRVANSGRFKTKYATEEERRNARLASKRAYWHKCKSKQKSNSILPDSAASTSETPRGIREELHPRSVDPGLASVPPVPQAGVASAEPGGSSPAPSPLAPQNKVIQQDYSQSTTHVEKNLTPSSRSSNSVAAPVSPEPSTSAGTRHDARPRRSSLPTAQSSRRRSTRLASRFEFGEASIISRISALSAEEMSDCVPSSIPVGALCTYCKVRTFLAPTRDLEQCQENEDASGQNWWSCIWCRGVVEENCLSRHEKKMPVTLICKFCLKKLQA